MSIRTAHGTGANALLRVEQKPLDELRPLNAEDTVEGLAQALKPLGVRRGRLAVSASHTHSAPCMTDVAPHIFGKKLVDAEQAAVDRYTAEVRMHDYHWPPGTMDPPAIIERFRSLGCDVSVWGA